MTILKILFDAFVIFCVMYTISNIILYLIEKYKEKKRANEKRYCHHCRQAYTYSCFDDYVYCPICGRELTFIDDVKEEK